MKRILLLTIAACMAISVTGSAFAHPGRTDSQGGHTDRDTGEYHFHHGYPAHQHEDRDGDGVKEYCPYNFSDNTGANSGTPSSRTSPSRPATYVPVPAPVPKVITRETTATTPPTTAAVYSSGSKESNNSGWEDAIVAGFAAICLFFWILWAILKKSDFEKEIQRKQDLLDAFQRDAAQQEAVLGKQIRGLSESLAEETEKARQYKAEASQMKVQLAATQQQAKELQEKVNELSVQLTHETHRATQAEKDYGLLQSEFSTTMKRLHAIGDPEDGQTDGERILFLAQQIQEKDEKIQALSTELDKYIKREKIPRDVFYAADGMPVRLKYLLPRYGDFTVYLNRETKVYHADKHCAPIFAYEQHLFKVLGMHGARPCMKCARHLPTELPDWWDGQQK